MTLAAIQVSVLQLPANEKAALIDLLWDSLDRADISKRESNWAIESEERIDAVERGELGVMEGPAALQALRQSLR